ncbi:hypothetical protein FPV67DRAFT_1514768 [Lyophyllum atratum]|nr:hypothetical protein FPV67DRAFT_1514768 [Lyophyllum atratum]
MSWTPYLHKVFGLVRVDHELAYNGGYNAILSMLFDPLDHHFIPGELTSVLVLAINPRSALDDKYRRQEADAHMRGTLKEEGSNVFPRLYGISAFGTRIRVYCYDTRSSQIDPPAVPSTSTAAPLKEWWDMDVMSPAGEQKIREIEANIKAMCAPLSD